MQLDATASRPSAIATTTNVREDGRGDPLRAVAQDLEAAFLAEMLKHSGLGTARESFGGGMGEDQFASFLTQEHARLITERGGIGLAESIYQALVERGIS